MTQSAGQGGASDPAGPGGLQTVARVTGHGGPCRFQQSQATRMAHPAVPVAFLHSLTPPLLPRDESGGSRGPQTAVSPALGPSAAPLWQVTGRLQSSRLGQREPARGPGPQTPSPARSRGQHPRTSSEGGSVLPGGIPGHPGHRWESPVPRRPRSCLWKMGIRDEVNRWSFQTRGRQTDGRTVTRV